MPVLHLTCAVRRGRYAMATAYWHSLLCYVRWAVLPSRVLPSTFALSDTEIAHAAITLRACYAMCGTRCGASLRCSLVLRGQINYFRAKSIDFTRNQLYGQMNCFLPKARMVLCCASTQVCVWCYDVPVLNCAYGATPGLLSFMTGSEITTGSLLLSTLSPKP
eukprot:3940589-Rhodomonas_salina.1